MSPPAPAVPAPAPPPKPAPPRPVAPRPSPACNPACAPQCCMPMSYSYPAPYPAPYPMPYPAPQAPSYMAIPSNGQNLCGGYPGYPGYPCGTGSPGSPSPATTAKPIATTPKKACAPMCLKFCLTVCPQECCSANITGVQVVKPSATTSGAVATPTPSSCPANCANVCATPCPQVRMILYIDALSPKVQIQFSTMISIYTFPGGLFLRELIKDQDISPSVIILLILITFSLAYVSLSLGENLCWSREGLNEPVNSRWEYTAKPDRSI